MNNITSGSIGILNITPNKNVLNVQASANITVRFNGNMNIATLTNTNIRINGSKSGLHSALFTYDTTTNTVTINPNIDFKISETVEVTITQRVKSISGDSLIKPLVWRFTIAVLNGFSSFVKDTSFAINNPIGGILCDVENDGDLDEVLSSHDNGTITIYKNNGNGKFSLSSTLSGGGLAYTTYPPVCGDFNADGYIDVAAPVRFSNLVSVWFNNGDGTFSPAQQIGTDQEPDRINVADYNGDGFLDMAVRCHSSSSYYMDIMINDKTGHFVRTQQYPLPARLHEQCSGDFDGDGDIDIAFATHDSNLHLLINDGYGHFTEPLPVVPSVHNYSATADLDGDGNLDIVVNNPTGFAFFKNNGSGVFSLAQQLNSTGNSFGFKQLMDIDGDGDIDIVVPNWTLNREEFYINNGTGNFASGYTIQGWSSNNAYEIDAGDLNGNGNLDLAGPNTGSFVVYRAILPLPTVPALISPVNGSIGVLLTPLMDWSDASGVLNYEIQLSTNAGFTNIIFDSAGITASQITIPSGKLIGNVIYHWRVNANNSAGSSAWSSVWSFTTFGIPAVPVLFSPSNNSENISLTPMLIWNSVPNTSNYRLQLSIDSNFSSLVIYDSAITQSYYNVPIGKLTNNTKYYWRVCASNVSGVGSWCALWAFTTTGLPGQPVLVSPVNNSINMPLTPTLFWNNIQNALYYTLQLSNDSTFSTFVISDSSITQTYFFITSGILNNNVKYFWRVKAKNTYGWGVFSSQWNFRTELISSVNNYLPGLPDSYKLHNNYPNPFNPITKIRFDLLKNSITKVSIYDVSGKEIEQILNKNLNAGYYEVLWNASNYSSGVYFYRIEAGDFTDIKKMILLK